MATKKTATPTIETAVLAEKATTKKVASTPVTKTAEKATATTKTVANKTENTTKITFSLPKQAVGMAKTVAVVGNFNNWDIQNSPALSKQKDGSYAVTLELTTGKAYEFRFLINGEIWENAWDAPKYVPSPFGGDNSVVFA
jgi:1,4-alpha-glucan branching enzyme